MGMAPWPGPDGKGTLARDGVPPSPRQVRTWSGVPCPGMGYPPRPPGIGQQMESLLRGERYASCVHAGGLSCYQTKTTIFSGRQHCCFERHILLTKMFIRPSTQGYGSMIPTVVTIMELHWAFSPLTVNKTSFMFQQYVSTAFSDHIPFAF